MNNASPRSSRRPRSRKPRRFAALRPAFAASVASLLLFQGTARAITYYWTTSGGGTWGSNANWTEVNTGGANVGTFPMAGDIATFNTTILNSAETITLDGNQAAASLTFNNTGTTAITGGTGGTLTLSAGITEAATAGAVTIGGSGLAISQNANATYANNSTNGNTLTVSAPITFNTGTAAATLFVQGVGNTTITGGLSYGGSAAGNLSLTKTGASILTLGGTNTYTGTTSVDVGSTVRLDQTLNGTLSSTSLLSLTGGTFTLAGATGAAAQTLGTVTEGTTLGARVSTISADGGTGGSATLNLGGITVFAGATGAILNLNTPNSGVITTTQANTAGILHGRIVLNGNDFAVGNGASGAISGVATTALVTAAGTDTANSNVPAGGTALAGSRTTNSLTVRTDGSTLAVGAGNTLTLTSGGLLFTGTSDYTVSGGTLRGGTELIAHQYSSGNVTISSAIGGMVFTKAGTGALTLSGNNTNTGVVNLAAGALTLSGDNSAAGGGVTQLGGTTLNVNSATALGTGTYNVNQNAATVLPTLNNTSGNALTLTTNNAVTLTGSFNFGTGTGTANNSLTFGTGLVSETTNNITITLNGAGALTFGGAFTANRSSFLTVNNGTVTGTTSAVTFGGFTLQTTGTAAAISSTLNGSGAIVVNGPITNGISTAGSVTYGGTGSLTISGSGNTYTGGLAGSAGGTLNLNSTSALGASTSATTGVFSAAGTIDNTSGSAITMTPTGTNTANPISLGVVNYSTAAGTLNNNLNLGNGLVTANQGRVLTLNGAGVLTFGGTLTSSATGGITITVNNGAGTASTSAVNFGGFNLNSSTSATARVNSIAGSGNVNITGAVTDGSVGTGNGLTYSGTGRLTLSNAAGSSYTGNTTISSGTVVVSNTANSAFGTVGTVALGGATGVVATLASGAGNVGIVTNAITTNGRATSNISPGNAGTVGMLTLGNLTATSGTSFAFDLGASSGGTSSDSLSVTALAAPTTGTGGLAFNFNNLGAAPGTYTLVNYTSETGLDPNDLTSTGVAGSFNITNVTGGAGAITFTVAAVPEPSTWAGFGAAVCGWLAVRRLRRRTA